MPRKRRQTPENQGQMTFDFAFQETVNTIEDPVSYTHLTLPTIYSV